MVYIKREQMPVSQELVGNEAAFGIWQTWSDCVPEAVWYGVSRSLVYTSAPTSVQQGQQWQSVFTRQHLACIISFNLDTNPVRMRLDRQVQHLAQAMWLVSGGATF